MKLKEYAKAIAELAAEKPNALVVFASDEEGNSFSPVEMGPTLGHWDGEEFSDDGTKNAVCVN